LLLFASDSQTRRVFLGKKEVQKRLDAFLQDHPHQPLDVVACGAQYGMNGIARLTLQVTAVKPVVSLQVPNNRFNGLTPAGELVRYLEDGRIPIDNNHIENRIRPIAMGRSKWLFAGSLRAGKRAAAIMSLLQSAKLNGHDPYEYLKDVLTRLPTHPYRQIEDLLPHRWQPEPQLHHPTSH
jgi:hypothetical protein